MLFFRRSPSSAQLRFRPCTPNDYATLMQLFTQTEWLSLSMPQDELFATAEPQLSCVAELDGRIWAALIVTWAQPPAAWARAIVVRQPLRPVEVVPTLLQHAETAVAAAGGTDMYVMSDQFDLVWLRPLLLNQGYLAQVEVISYEKHSLFIPDWGNQQVSIRATTPADIPSIARIDSSAFRAEWVKSDVILENVLPIAPCYLIAERAGTMVGYAFATTHHGGSVAHLVRIAVHPSWQGQAIGVRLLAEVTHWCANNGVQILSLNTQASNTHAQRLYEWFGFVRVPERQIVMAKSLA